MDIGEGAGIERDHIADDEHAVRLQQAMPKGQHAIELRRATDIGSSSSRR